MLHKTKYIIIKKKIVKENITQKVVHRDKFQTLHAHICQDILTRAVIKKFCQDLKRV